MRRGKCLAIILCVGATLLSGFVLPAVPQTVQSVAATAGRSVCIVLAEGGNGTTSGTGFVIADGFVLTARHVVQNAGHLRVLCPEHAAIEVKLVNADADHDLALLQNPLLSIRPLPLGDSAKVQVGQEIVVIGFPRADLVGGVTATVTQGIVSAAPGGEVQIQAPVGPGNSGSPVLSLQGQVIGVVRAVLGSQMGSNFATSFATGINAAKPLVPPTLKSTATTPISSGSPGGQNVQSVPPPATARGSSNFVITPGQGIGDVKLGMNQPELEALLGPAMQVLVRADGINYLAWFPNRPGARGVWTFLSGGGAVIMVAVINDARYLIQGLHVGSSESDVRAALGEPSQVATATNTTRLWKTSLWEVKLLYYDSLGLRFSVANDRGNAMYGLVQEIAIYPANHPQ